MTRTVRFWNWSSVALTDHLDAGSAVIRKGSPVDADSIGRIFLRARDAMTYLPPVADQDRPKLGGWIAARHEIWVIEDRDRLMGFAGLSKGWLDTFTSIPIARTAAWARSCCSRSRDFSPAAPDCGSFKGMPARGDSMSIRAFVWRR